MENIFMDFSNPIFKLVIAVFLGAFVGLRREFELQQKREASFRGLRTTALVSAMGVVSTFFSDFKFLPILFFIFLAAILFVVYRNGVKQNKIGLTSEVSTLLIFWSGVLIGYEKFILGIILAFMVAISDAYKDRMHSFAKKINLKEWSGTLQMIIITLIVLPFLPKKAVDPWGVVVPYEVWLLVVIVTGIGFVGYFLDKFFRNGKIKGVYLTSFLGSLISSTAVVVKLSQKVKNEKKSTYFLPAVLLAIGVMMLRDTVLILFAGKTFRIDFLIIPISMAVVAFVLFGIYFWRDKKNTKKLEEIKLEEGSPFELIPSLKFAVIFVFILFVVHFAKEFFGNGAVYLTSTIVAFVDSETIILPVLESYHLGKFTVDVVVNILLIVLSINTLIKLAYIQMFAGKKYFWKTFLPILIVVILGSLSIFI